MADFRDGLQYLPRHMREGIAAYIETGRPAGSFLTAVLENDLIEAAGRADIENAAALKNWAMFLYSYAPSDCYGSPEIVKAWIKRGGLAGGS